MTKMMTKTAGASAIDRSRGEQCAALWKHLITRHPAEGRYARATKLPYRWRELPALRLVVVQYVSFEADQVGVFMRGEKGVAPKAVEDRLLPYANALGKLLGRKLSPGSKYFFQATRTFRTKDPGQWDKMAEWLHNQANKYENALFRVMKGRA
jgi:hypothetical protein